MAPRDPPLLYQWDGEAMRVRPAFAREADRQFVIGQVYRLVEMEDRSDASHKHEFAWLREAWKNLPEHLVDQFPSPEHLRKRALIETGFYHETVLDVGSAAAAFRVAATLRAMDEFAVVVVRGGVVVRREAKSQKRRYMDKHEFQASKTAIIEAVSDLIGVAPAQLLLEGPKP